MTNFRLSGSYREQKIGICWNKIESDSKQKIHREGVNEKRRKL